MRLVPTESSLSVTEGMTFLLLANSTSAPPFPAASSNPPPVPVLPPMDNTFGAWLIGTFASVLLQGLIFHQTYRYYRLYPKDALFLKLWVLAVLIVEMVNTALAMHVSYWYMVTNYAHPEVLLGKPVWSFTAAPIPGALAAIIVEFFFARRLWLIGPQFRILVVLAVILNLGFFSCFTALSILGDKATDLATYLDHSWLASAAAGMIGVADVMVTSSLIYVLHTSRTGVKTTNSMIDILIKYAVSTGLIICIFNILNVAFSIAYPHNWIFAGISITMTKLYANTFLVALNARHTLLSTEVLRMEQTTQFTNTVQGGRRGSASKGHALNFAQNSKYQATSLGFDATHVSAETQPGSEVLELKPVSMSTLEDRDAHVVKIKEEDHSAYMV